MAEPEITRFVALTVDHVRALLTFVRFARSKLGSPPLEVQQSDLWRDLVQAATALQDGLPDDDPLKRQQLL